jgi:Tfp pilus assembly protein PilF
MDRSIEQTLNLAREHERAGRLAQCRGLCEEILARRPNEPDALHLLGLLAQHQGQQDVALDLIGAALFQKRQFHQAIAVYEQAISLQIADSKTYTHLGAALIRTGQIEQAIKALRHAISLKPGNVSALNYLAMAFQIRGDFSAAIEHYQLALEIEPGNAEVHWSLGLVQLVAGDYESGWKHFEWRLRLPRLKLAKKFAEPQWRGEDLRGKRIFLFTEGGFGDALHFIRYAPMVADRGATVILECQPELVRLLRGVRGISGVVVRGEELTVEAVSPVGSVFDYQVPLQSLPVAFGTRLESVPAEVPYLSVASEEIAKWGSRLVSEKLKVGLVWAGSDNPKDLRSRSLEVFGPLSQVAGVEFYSLQKGRESAQMAPPGMSLINLGDALGDFYDTAAAVMNLDLVVSVDTSIVHLAGALGKPVWALIPMFADFRWVAGRNDSRWYPTMKLFRQVRQGSWGEPIEGMVRELRGYIQRRPSPLPSPEGRGS